jgi:hypothetical protein
MCSYAIFLEMKVVVISIILNNKISFRSNISIILNNKINYKGYIGTYARLVVAALLEMRTKSRRAPSK